MAIPGALFDFDAVRVHEIVGGNPCAWPMFDLSSDPATTIETMLITLNTPTLNGEAAPVASLEPCGHSFDVERRPGYVLALSGRRAR